MSEYLSEDEQLEKLRNWWQKNGTGLLVGIVLVVGGYAAYNWYESDRLERAAAASDLYEAYLAADEATRPTLAAELAETAPDSSYHGFVLMQNAADAVAEGDLETAEQHLQKALETDGALLRDLVRIRLAAVLQGLDRSDEAMRQLDQVSGEGYRRLALELKGDIHVAKGEIAAAHTAYTEAQAALAEDERAPLLEAKVTNTAVAPAAEPEGEEQTASSQIEEANAAEQEQLEEETPEESAEATDGDVEGGDDE